jgi:hypothetical protein
MAKTRKITDTEWDAHKESITALYKVHPLAQVRRIMEENYSFFARFALCPTLLILLTDTLAKASTPGNLINGASKRIRPTKRGNSLAMKYASGSWKARKVIHTFKES